MEILFPAIDDSDSPAPGGARVSDSRLRTILVADDEEAIRGVCEDILTAKGYRVLSAADGVDAVETFKRHQERVDLVIMDIVMPNLNGRSAAKAIRAIRPGLKVLFISGCSDKSQISALHSEGFKHFLAKPFSVFQMQKLVDEMLEDPDEKPDDF